jgi:sugar lactone lactonase YvrE
MLGVSLLTLLISGCAGWAPQRTAIQAKLTEVATSPRQWTGVAVSKTGRIFVNFPRRPAEWGPSVAEILPNGKLQPFPNQVWNPPADKPELRPQEYFIDVQSLVIDAADFLWVLDAANPGHAGIVPGGPKLVRIDLRTSKVVQVVNIPPEAALPTSDLNDLQVDLRTGTAYISDSGNGALIVTDVAEGTSRRLLNGHHSVTSEGTVVNLAGKAWRLPNGSFPEVHLKGLALTPDGDYLYYQALTARTLYRVPTAVLRNPELSIFDVEEAVRLVGLTGVADGLVFAPDGYLYLTDVEHGAIYRLTQNGLLELVVQDPRLSWPDSLAVDSDGVLYVTSSLMHLPVGKGPYRLFRIEISP